MPKKVKKRGSKSDELLILKLLRPDFFDIRCLSWNTATIVFMKTCRMDRRRYKSRH